MTALVRLAVPSEEAETKASDVLIHVRYTPSAEIFFIDALPAHLTPREWLDRLLAGASDYYQVLAGGRGFFRIPCKIFEVISPPALSAQAAE
ncbi:hypothetical protein [Bradyrhizobium sp. G127]|jgi:hypothetical protein|uniref:hypothetical protein n=1 Tax=Bradyrhizobium sp. G127 TaxID=2904800 RepID=UPI001F2D53B6|nr:hypothetical protein [Bradyrhizobium sp. G127]MCF2521745.1 hypothetical protein [Bradyrhizobium sp. G127]